MARPNKKSQLGQPPMKTRIKQAARDLFIQRGLADVSYGDIAEVVNTTRANLHYHFGNKNALIEAVFCIAGAIVFALILWASWPKLVDSWGSSEFFGVQGVWTIPTWPFRGITVLGAAIATLAALYRAALEFQTMGGRT